MTSTYIKELDGTYMQVENGDIPHDHVRTKATLKLHGESVGKMIVLDRDYLILFTDKCTILVS
jgi:hypothetical protein